jgi:hypothetical protein
LDDVPIRVTACQLEYIRAGRQSAPGNLHRIFKGEDGLFVLLIGAYNTSHDQQHSK